MFLLVLVTVPLLARAACTTKITFGNEPEGAADAAFFISNSDDFFDLDAKLFCTKFSLTPDICNTMTTYHSKNCMSDAELYKNMAFSVPNDCQTNQCFLNRYMTSSVDSTIGNTVTSIPKNVFNANSLLHEVMLNNEMLLHLYSTRKDQMILSIPNVTEVDVCGISHEEAYFLYSLAYQTTGLVLEEGCYCGCSTIFLAAGVRNRGQVLGEEEEKRTFITSDTFAAGIESNSPTSYNKIGDGKIGLQVWGQTIEGFHFPEKDYHAFFGKVLSPLSKYGGSMLNCLYSQLFAQNLHDFVSIVAGSSKNVPRMPFRLIFSDAAHDQGEIASNADNWIANVKEFQRHRTYTQSNDTMIFVFHDVAVASGDLIGQINTIFTPFCKSYSAVTYMSIYAIELFF